MGEEAIKDSGTKQPAKINEGLLRMKFLKSAAESLICTNAVMAAYYASTVQQIAKKNQVKVEKEFKRLVCKGCSCLLKPNHTAVVKIMGKHRSQKKIGLTCDLCSTRKCILISNKPAFVRNSNRRKKNNSKLKGKKN